MSLSLAQTAVYHDVALPSQDNFGDREFRYMFDIRILL